MGLIVYFIILLLMAAGIPTAAVCKGEKIAHLNNVENLILLVAVLLISIIPLALYFNHGKKKFGEKHRHIIISSAATVMVVYVSFYMFIWNGLTPLAP
ncbi:hypothetical protein [Ruminococcus albus]|uniref:Uncharacterized protein n=1 Tax=Ruminococcus albus TaxID=1264 RepID=A0A1H7N5Y0_RUMAL|nr:hypothetical protein [Ruminococcus albus]SEL18824.1 hypothetical protein SAMN05216469_1145 [Ruminococcus albus]